MHSLPGAVALHVTPACWGELSPGLSHHDVAQTYQHTLQQYSRHTSCTCVCRVAQFILLLLLPAVQVLLSGQVGSPPSHAVTASFSVQPVPAAREHPCSECCVCLDVGVLCPGKGYVWWCCLRANRHSSFGQPAQQAAGLDDAVHSACLQYCAVLGVHCCPCGGHGGIGLVW